MPSEMSLGDEIAKHSLFEQRSMSACDRECRGNVVHQIGRDHQVSQTQRRKENLAEASREQHKPVAVESLKRRYRASPVTILAVIIVFENERAGLPGPLQQLQTSGEAHRDSAGKLVTWGDVDQPPS